MTIEHICNLITITKDTCMRITEPDGCRLMEFDEASELDLIKKFKKVMTYLIAFDALYIYTGKSKSVCTRDKGHLYKFKPIKK